MFNIFLFSKTIDSLLSLSSEDLVCNSLVNFSNSFPHKAFEKKDQFFRASAIPPLWIL